MSPRSRAAAYPAQAALGETGALIDKFRSDSQRGVIVLLGVITAATLVGFAVFRASQGQWAAAATDLAIALAIIGPVAYALRTGHTAGPGVLMCVSNALGCAVACWVVGASAMHWIFLVLMTSFFVTGPRLALVSNLLLTAVVLSVPGLFENLLHQVSVAVTAALVTLFAYLFAIHVRSDQHVLETMASLDALTGVPNRRAMEHALTTALERHRAGQGNYGLVIMDIDHFKEVNDSYGHAAGDTAIADLAAILKFQMRKQDFVFRFGGEEFVVLLAVDSREGLHAATERLRLAVRSGLRGPGGRITVSLGAAMASDEERWQEWFSLADEALYRAKNGGRDNSVIAEAQT